MDATWWHRRASQSLARPAPVVLSKLEAMSDRDREGYLESVLQWVGNLYLPCAAATTVTTGMDQVVEANQYTPAGAKTLVALSGPNTAGKSTLVRRWAQSRYRRRLNAEDLTHPELPTWRPTPGVHADYIPLVWINLQAGAQRKEFNAQMLHFLGYPGEGVTRATSERVAAAVANHGIELVIVDDVHLLRTQSSAGRVVLDHLKFINTVLGEHHASMVLVGANLRGSDLAADPQIAGRLRMLEMPSFEIDTPEQKVTWQGLLKSAETELLPFLPQASQGFLSSRAGLIWRRTQGYLGDLGNLLRQAAHAAVRGEQWTITPEQLITTPLSERASAAEAALLNRQRRGRRAS